MEENTFKIFQTLEDRKDKIEAIIKAGPIKAYDICPHTGNRASDRRETWLGEGYYFWETDIEHAHWWGKEVKKYDYKSGYIICRAEYDFSSELCFDLYGNTKHKAYIRSIYTKLRIEGLLDDSTTVKEVINWLGQNIKTFNRYKAIRVDTTMRSKMEKSANFSSIPFLRASTNNKKVRVPNLILTSRVQICFFDLESFNVRNFDKIYPVEESDKMEVYKGFT